jgi:hypothetical protein
MTVKITPSYDRDAGFDRVRLVLAHLDLFVKQLRRKKDDEADVPTVIPIREAAE